jgi:hypothetical protein
MWACAGKNILCKLGMRGFGLVLMNYAGWYSWRKSANDILKKQMHSTYKCMYVFMNVHMYVCITYIHTYFYIHTYIRTFTYKHKYFYEGMNVYTYVCMYVCCRTKCCQTKAVEWWMNLVHAITKGTFARPHKRSHLNLFANGHGKSFPWKRYFLSKVARFFLVQTYQNGKKYNKWPQTIPNSHKLYQMAIKYSKWS